MSIPEDLYESIRKSIEGKGFNSVDDYVTYVLHVTIGKSSSTTKGAETDDEKVMQQLKSLGYI